LMACPGSVELFVWTCADIGTASKVTALVVSNTGIHMRMNCDSFI
jgi:hypothetical protein